jgi:hypothetical protein
MRSAIRWMLGAALLLDAVGMLALMYALGPAGTCEDDLNTGAILLTWLVATGVGGVVAYPAFVTSARTIVPDGRWRYAIAFPVALGTAAALFAIGLVVVLTHTACVD